jgi:hypothetical protein
VNNSEFDVAINALNVRGQDSIKLFTSLMSESVHKSQKQVAIGEIEELFKAYAAHLKGSTDEVLTKILQAFNCDIKFIEDQLKARVQDVHQDGKKLSQDEFMKFFDEWTKAGEHYSADEVGSLAFTYLSTHGGVNLDHFIAELNATKNEKKLQP